MIQGYGVEKKKMQVINKAHKNLILDLSQFYFF